MIFVSKLSGWKRAGLIGLAMVGVALIAAGCATAPAGGQSSQYLTNTITVVGSGDAQGAPDVAYLQLGIDVVASDPGAAIKEANAVMDKVQAAVKQAGVADEDMQTANFNVYPEDVYDPTTGQPTGQRRYHVNNFLNVKIKDVSKVGDVIDGGLNSGATNVSSLYFGVDDTAELEKEARGKAIEDAKSRAQQLADGLGVKLGPAIIVNESIGYPGPIPYAYDGRMAGLGGGPVEAAAAPISPGQMTVTMQVSVTFTILP